MSSPMLQVVGLSCERDDRDIFHNLSFSLQSGEILQIDGPNGAGKTSLIRILSGLLQSSEGEVYWQGEDIAEDRSAYNKDMLYLGHCTGINPSLTPLENLQWLAAIHAHLDSTLIPAALKSVALEGYEDVPCHQLSAGQNRRVSLARLYMSCATFWLLDEPFTAIDRQGVGMLESQMQRHASRGGCVILTTHHVLPESMCRRTLSLRGNGSYVIN